jgi:hypothetical protein
MKGRVEQPWHASFLTPRKNAMNNIDIAAEVANKWRLDKATWLHCLYSRHPLNPYPIGHGLKSMGFEGVWVYRELPKMGKYNKNIFRYVLQ